MRKSVFALVAVAAFLVPSAAASAREPILFVHGWSGAAWNWDIMIDRFEGDGYAPAELRAFSYNTAQSNAATAQEVAAEVESLRAATGAGRVDIVAHSMGSLIVALLPAQPGRNGARRRVGVDRRTEPRHLHRTGVLGAGVVPGDGARLVVPGSSEQRRRNARRGALRDVLVTV